MMELMYEKCLPFQLAAHAIPVTFSHPSSQHIIKLHKTLDNLNNLVNCQVVLSRAKQCLLAMLIAWGSLGADVKPCK